MRDHEKQFKRAGVQVVLVGLGAPEQAEAFRKDFDLNFPIVCDPNLVLFKAYKLKRMGLLQLASPSLMVKGVKAMSQGYRMGKPQGDIYQLPGVFIIDTKGLIRLSHYGKDPADHPSAEDILDAVSKLET